MSLVVSDTSPLVALHYLGDLTLLQTFFGSILVPPAVAMELKAPRGSGGSVDVSQFPYIEVRTPSNLAHLQKLMLTLDIGEAEAIALAIEVHADTILIDELDGRAAAARAGLERVGVLGVLARARREGLISNLRPRLDRLRNEMRFFIADALYGQVLHSVGE